ncbi:Sulfotransferase family protein [Amphritea atlantica]|uniref:Sulfotransferase family protein n=1 Tax=Amphritea atlantica TaxID=355243 RepID=A0A1H9CKV0_9GAMM|nr:sulfotransferase domain-containing protein [Amphritea atlantica]SEQ01856.1 Sulfotransferase family protein [Amphritea atlantica]
MSQNKNYPSVILCGYERGGTTLLSEIFRSNGYESGFECGVLMCEKPSHFIDFKPYSNMIKSGWKLEFEINSYIPKNDSFVDFYHNILKGSGLDKKANKFFDKTPIYMRDIGKCLSRAPFIDKAIIITRDPRSIFTSWAKRAKDSEGLSLEEIINSKLPAYSSRYNRYFAGAIAERDNPKVMFVSFENLCLDPKSVYQSLGFFTEGSAFKPIVNTSRFKNVYSNEFKLDKVNEYDSYLSTKIQNKILDNCAISALFFSSNNERIKHLNTFFSLDKKIRDILSKYNLDASTIDIDGQPFNPWLYLFLNRDILNLAINPVMHYKNNGIIEKRPF